LNDGDSLDRRHGRPQGKFAGVTGGREARISAGLRYLASMVRQYEYQPCVPTRGTEVPSGSDFIHEVKYDGYRVLVEREGDRVRLFSRNGTEWTKRYPWIVEAARKIRQQRFVLDGEAVVLGVDGIADFNALHSRQHDEEVQFCAFDILLQGGEDLRKLPLHLRKTSLARLLARRPEGIFVNPFERGEIGTELFLAACRMGLEGLVSKHRERPYQAGRSRHWIKVKNRKHPAIYRVMDALRD
jgi:bifunctional non-homologous end joining protein LigD